MTGEKTFQFLSWKERQGKIKRMSPKGPEGPKGKIISLLTGQVMRCPIMGMRKIDSYWMNLHDKHKKKTQDTQEHVDATSHGRSPTHAHTRTHASDLCVKFNKTWNLESAKKLSRDTDKKISMSSLPSDRRRNK